MSKNKSICKNCINCLYYSDPEEKNDLQFNILGKKKGIYLFEEPGAFCVKSGILIDFNVLECEKFKEKEMNFIQKKIKKKVKKYSKDITDLQLFDMIQEKKHGEAYLISWLSTAVKFRIAKQKAKKKLLNMFIKAD